MPEGTGCMDLTLACRVPFGGSDVNLTSAVMVCALKSAKLLNPTADDSLSISTPWSAVLPVA